MGEFRPSKPGERRGGRQKGTLNKTTLTLKEAILQAGEEAHPEGLTGYLKLQSVDNPTAFMTLLGKVLPMQIAGDGNASGALVVTWGGPEPKATNADD